MVDQEVTDILEEIRSRVRASEVLPGTGTPQTSNGDRGKTDPETLVLNQTPNKSDYSSLAVMARAWDRLPPLVSNRSGVTARLELWIKSKLKTALRWFTWEQVNFNAATHRTFLDLIESVNACEQQLIQLKNQLNAESSAMRGQLDAQRADLLAETQTQCDRIQAAVDSQQVELNKQWASLSAQQAELNARLTELTTLQSGLNARFDELKLQQSRDTNDLHSQLAQRMQEQNVAAEAHLATLVKEFRERDERLLDEQRVCFRQLSLEVSESQILQDRVRRDLESRITKLEPLKPK